MKFLIVMLAILLIPITASADNSDPDKPVRQGFTMEVGLGEGLTQSLKTPDSLYIQHISEVGFAPPSLSIGWFTDRDTSVSLREVGTAYYNYESAQSRMFNFIGPAMQEWFGDYFFLGGGLGLSLYGKDPFNFHYNGPKVGFGATERIGVSVVSDKHISVALTFDMLQGVFDTPHNLPETVMAGGVLGLQAQFY